MCQQSLRSVALSSAFYDLYNCTVFCT
jgi:hypothetical protein